jgi:hypothetical protein
MNFNNSALMKAVGVGAGLGVIIGIGGSIPVVSLACCCIGWLLWMAAGASYGFFDQKDGNPADMGTWALGGAIVGAAGGLVRGIIGGVVSMIYFAVSGGTAAVDPQMYIDMGVPPELAAQMASATSSGGGVIGVLTSVCIFFFVIAVLGAIGGAIYAAVRRSQTPTYTPPPAM